MIDDTLDEEQLAHAPLGPSSAEGWSTCADYVNANRGLPNHDTRASAEGTFAHWVSEQCLANGEDAVNYVGHAQQVKDWTFRWTADDAELLQPGLDQIRAISGRFFGEHRVDISAFTLPGQFGTCDRAVVDGDWLSVADLKWGRGVPVYPVQNKQIMLYALGFYWRFRDQLPGIRHVRLIIDQPRHAGGGGIWECSLDDLLAFGDWIRERAAATAEPNPSRTASLKGCQWCRRRRAPGGCETFDRYIVDILGLDLEMAELIDGSITLPTITPERRSIVLAHKKLISDWVDTMQEQELQDGLRGGDTPGRKPVLGNRTPAKWTDKVAAEDLVAAVLGEDGFTQRLKTPTQVGKAVDAVTRVGLESLIDFGEKKPVMVPAEDARDRYVPVSADDLPDLPPETEDTQ